MVKDSSIRRGRRRVSFTFRKVSRYNAYVLSLPLVPVELTLRASIIIDVKTAIIVPMAILKYYKC